MPACLASKGCGNYGQARRPAPPMPGATCLRKSHSFPSCTWERGDQASKLNRSLIKRNNARPVGVPGRVGVHRVRRVEAVAGALLVILIPEIAALPDAIAQAGKRADGGGVVSHHILRIMAGSARPTWLNCWATLQRSKTSWASASNRTSNSQSSRSSLVAVVLLARPSSISRA